MNKIIILTIAFILSTSCSSNKQSSPTNKTNNETADIVVNINNQTVGEIISATEEDLIENIQSSTFDLDFGQVSPNEAKLKTVLIKNESNSSKTISIQGATNPFSVLLNRCNNRILRSGESCLVTLRMKANPQILNGQISPVELVINFGAEETENLRILMKAEMINSVEDSNDWRVQAFLGSGFDTPFILGQSMGYRYLKIRNMALSSADMNELDPQVDSDFKILINRCKGALLPYQECSIALFYTRFRDQAPSEEDSIFSYQKNSDGERIGYNLYSKLDVELTNPITEVALTVMYDPSSIIWPFNFATSEEDYLASNLSSLSESIPSLSFMKPINSFANFYGELAGDATGKEFYFLYEQNDINLVPLLLDMPKTVTVMVQCQSGYLPNVNNTDCEEIIAGCTDPLASNYNPLAGTDDGSCEYAPQSERIAGYNLADPSDVGSTNRSILPNRMFAQQFTTTQEYTVTQMTAKIFKGGTPTGVLRYRIVNDVSNNPPDLSNFPANTRVQGSVSIAELSANPRITLAMDVNEVLPAGTYWFVIQPEYDSGTFQSGVSFIAIADDSSANPNDLPKAREWLSFYWNAPYTQTLGYEIYGY